MKKHSKKFGQFLSTLRQERGLTQDQLASACDLSPSSIARQEQMDRCRLRPTNLESVVNYLHYHKALSPDDVIYLKVHGRLRDNWAAAETRSNAPKLLEIAFFEKHFPGDMRAKCNEVHESLMLELGARVLLTELLGIAAKRNIRLDVAEDVN